LQKNIITAVSNDFNPKNSELGNHNPLVAEFNTISEMVEKALAEVSIGGQIVQEAICDAFHDRQRALGSNYRINAIGKTIAGDGSDGPMFANVMTISESDLGANWGQDLQIDEAILPDFHIDLSIKTLKEIRQYGNRYARTVAGVIGYRQNPDNIFNGVKDFSDTTSAKWAENPTPYSVCGLGDLGQLVALNKMFQSLQGRWPLSPTDLGADALQFDQRDRNRGSQFAPEDLGNAHQGNPNFTYGSRSPAFSNVR
jgi:hypothetical protein